MIVRTRLTDRERPFPSASSIQFTFVLVIPTMINIDKWNTLPKHYQAVLEQAGHYANTWMIAKYDLLNPPALRRLLASGAKLHGFSPEIMEACFKSAKELHDEIATTNANFKKVYEPFLTKTHQRASLSHGWGGGRLFGSGTGPQARRSSPRKI